MQFQITKSQKDIQKAAREFAKGEFDKSLCLEMEKSGVFCESIRRKAATLGFLAIHFPEEQGGVGLGMLETALVAEALCERDASAGIALMLSGFGAECLLQFGSDEQKRSHLSGVLSGTALCATAFAEAAAPFDLTGIDTTARREAVPTSRKLGMSALMMEAVMAEATPCPETSATTMPMLPSCSLKKSK